MPLGVLMLDTRFARFVGDIGNPQSYERADAVRGRARRDRRQGRARQGAAADR